jgi:hypothetical protein
MPAQTVSMTEYVSGGYYVLKLIPRPTGVSEILPNHLLTLSNCFTTVPTDIIQLQWDEYDKMREAIAEEATEFGIPKTQIAELVRWAKAQPNDNYLVYSNIAPALELINRFVKDSATRAVGIALRRGLFESFQSQLPKDVNKGLGLLELINEQQPPADGGNPVGFEPLGFEGTKFHSWLCHYAPDEVYKRFGIRPNQLGLIDKLEDAQQVNDYLLQTGAEPAIWVPWLVLDYTTAR